MSKQEVLKRRLERITPDDVITALFFSINGEKVTKDPEKIHTAIYKLKEEDGFKDFLSDIIFDVSGISPYSELLDRILFRLETSEILGSLNPKYEKYDLEDKEKIKQKVYKKFSKQEELIKKMSLEFEQLLSN